MAAVAPAASSESKKQVRPKESDEEYRKRLTADQFRVTRQAGTERAFTGAFWDNKESGMYECVCCGQELFSSATKFDSGTGWPSFWDFLPGTVKEHTDKTHGMVRVEVVCSNCDAHLGHVFEDGPRETTGLRYCINSASLKFDKRSDVSAASGVAAAKAAGEKVGGDASVGGIRCKSCAD